MGAIECSYLNCRERASPTSLYYCVNMNSAVPTRITKEQGTEICYDISDPSIVAMECALDYCLDSSLLNCFLLDASYFNRIGRTF